jgi:hypothetical protein
MHNERLARRDDDEPYDRPPEQHQTVREPVPILHNECRVVYEMSERTRERCDNRRVRSLRFNHRERRNHFTARTATSSWRVL